MSKIVQFPGEAPSKAGFQRIKSSYTAREMSRQFGLSEKSIREWTREGLLATDPSAEAGQVRFDIRALKVFRRIRELRGQGLSMKQIHAELRGQLNLFPKPEGQLIRLPRKLSTFEEAVVLHERGDKGAMEAYRRAVSEGDSEADAYCNMGILEFEDGRILAAFRCFTDSLKQDPQHFEAHFNLANLYHVTGDLRLARLHYEIAGEIEPNFADLYFNLGLVYAATAELTNSIRALTQYKKLVPEEEGNKADDLLASLKRAISSMA